MKGAAALANLANTKYVNTHDAKTQLSKLIARVRAGEKIAICQAGKPVALLTAFEPARRKPRLGMWAGKIQLRPGWDSEETDREIEEMSDVLKESDDRRCPKKPGRVLEKA